MTKPRTLDEFKGEKSSGSVDACFENGVLSVSGVLYGDYIEQTMGDWDYEFGFRVKLSHMNALYRLLSVEAGDEEGLLDAIVDRFARHEGKSYSVIADFLKKNAIEFEEWQWR